MEYEIGQAQVYLHRSTTRCLVPNMLTETQTKVFSIGAGGCSGGRSFSHPKFRPDIPCCFNNSSETCRLVPALGQHRLGQNSGVNRKLLPPMATGYARPMPPWAASRAIALGIPKREWNIAQPDPSGNTPPPPKDSLWWRVNRNAAPVPGPNPLRKVFPRHLPPGWQDVKTNLLDDGKADIKARFGWGVSAPGDETAAAAAVAAKGVGAADTKHQPKAQGKGAAAKVKGGKASGVPKKKAAVARKPAAKATQAAVGAGARAAAARAAARASSADDCAISPKKGPAEWSSGGSTDQGSSDSDDGPTPTSPPPSPPSSTTSTFRHSVERCAEHSDGSENLPPAPPASRWMPTGPTLEA